jgi:hypothetical protein
MPTSVSNYELVNSFHNGKISNFYIHIQSWPIVLHVIIRYVFTNYDDGSVKESVLQSNDSENIHPRPISLKE